jgi:hypothetical protein
LALGFYLFPQIYASVIDQKFDLIDVTQKGLLLAAEISLLSLLVGSFLRKPCFYCPAIYGLVS